MRRQVLTALAVGCAAGWMLSTAAMAGCRSARADDVVSVECKDSRATYELPDADPETVARLTAVVTVGSMQYQAPVVARGTKVDIDCSPGGHVVFVLR